MTIEERFWHAPNGARVECRPWNEIASFELDSPSTSLRAGSRLVRRSRPAKAEVTRNQFAAACETCMSHCCRTP